MLDDPTPPVDRRDAIRRIPLREQVEAAQGPSACVPVPTREDLAAGVVLLCALVVCVCVLAWWLVVQRQRLHEAPGPGRCGVGVEVEAEQEVDHHGR